jgi:hypothetical protein
MKYLLLIFMFFATVAHAEMPTNRFNSAKLGTDGYKFSTPQYSKSQIQVNIKLLSNDDEVTREARSQGGVFEGTISAFSVLKKDSCDVYIVDPNKKYRPELLGHEITHCIFGQFHTDNFSTK